ncbi:MAG: hypothetical protein J0G34_04735 [Afipia sp.]|nr:hypothetical protein [Afipia sp.]
MKQFNASQTSRPSGPFVRLLGGDAVRLVCAALILASVAAWFRIVSIW